MAIDEKLHGVATPVHSEAGARQERQEPQVRQERQGAAAPSARLARPEPRFIATGPEEMTDDDAMARPAASNQEPRMSATVGHWPTWLQQQWQTTQRRHVWQDAHPSTRLSRMLSPMGMLVLSAFVVIALIGVGIGAALGARSASGTVQTTTSSSSAHSNSTSGMSGGTSSAGTANVANVPNATQSYGNQLAPFVVEQGGIKHFTFTAKQVMWEPLRGHRVLAWTLDGTVPGPMIRATAGDHVRITIINHLPEATAIHWHGLEVPSNQDGVPGIGMKPIAVGQMYTYDFTLHDQDAGTHWYHTHYDDIVQMQGGLYGAFIVDPRPGSPEARAAVTADVEYTEFISQMPNGYYVLNGKSFPDTQPIAVQHGQTVHLRLIGADTTMAHPMHLHGHTFSIVAEDGHTLPQPIQKDTINVAPGETFDLTFTASAAPGSVYPFHCHILSHLMNPGQAGVEMGGLIALIVYAK